MALKIRYEKDLRGTNEIMNGAAMQAVLLARAEAGKAHAISISPRMTGDYAASFETSVRAHGGPREDRAEAILANTSDHAADVEWRNHGGERILGRTVDFLEGT
jgi:hypothetical protein